MRRRFDDINVYKHIYHFGLICNKLLILLEKKKKILRFWILSKLFVVHVSPLILSNEKIGIRRKAFRNMKKICPVY